MKNASKVQRTQSVDVSKAGERTRTRDERIEASLWDVLLATHCIDDAIAKLAGAVQSGNMEAVVRATLAASMRVEHVQRHVHLGLNEVCRGR